MRWAMKAIGIVGALLLVAYALTRIDTAIAAVGAAAWLVGSALASVRMAMRWVAPCTQASHGRCLLVRLPPARARPIRERDDDSFGWRVVQRIAGLPWTVGCEVLARSDHPVQLRVWAPVAAIPTLRSVIESAMAGIETEEAPDPLAQEHAWIGAALFDWSSWWAPIDVDRTVMGAIIDAHHRIGPSMIAQTTIAMRRSAAWMRWRASALRWRARRARQRRAAGDRSFLQRVERIVSAPFVRASVWTVVAGDSADRVRDELDRIVATMVHVIRKETLEAKQALEVRRMVVLPRSSLERSPPQRMVAAGVGVSALISAALGWWLTGDAVAWGAWGAFAGALASMMALDGHPAALWRRMVDRSLCTSWMHLSAVEASGLWTNPLDDRRNVERTPNLRLRPNQSAFQSAQRADWVALALGQRSAGQWEPVGATLRDMRRILHLTAGMGAGKSRLLANIVQQLAGRPIGMCVIDGKGDDQGSLAWLSLDLIPLEREADIVWINPLERSWPVALNPLQTASADASDAANQLLAMLARLDAGGWSKAHGMEQLAMHAGILVAETVAHPTLAHVKRALLDDDYRTELLGRVRNPETRNFWRSVYPSGEKAMRMSRDALIRRLDKVLAPDVVRWMFTSPHPSVRFTELMEGSAIVLAPIPSEQLGGVAYAVAVLLVRDIVASAFRRAGADLERTDWPLIVDEVQVLVDQTGDNADFRSMLTRLRSLGIPAVYAHQSLSQLGAAVDEMLVNASNRVILRTPPPDAEVYARRYGHYGVTASDIASQPPNEHQYLDLVCDGVPTGLFSARPLPWPAPSLPSFEPWQGMDWRDVRCPTPSALAHQRIDGIVEQLMDLQRRAPLDMLDQCAAWAERLDDETWHAVRERWSEHCAAQRDFLLRFPQAVPNHRLRRITISALRYGRPVVVAMIEYLRMLPHIAGDGRTPLTMRDVNAMVYPRTNELSMHGS